MRFPNGATIVGFADVELGSVAKTLKEIEVKMHAAIQNVGALLNEAGLAFVAHKTEVVLISGRKIMEKMEAKVGGIRIESKKAIVIIDDRLIF